MKSLRLFLLVALAFLAINVQAQTWNLVWADEFNTGISGDWVFETGTGSGGWGNNELQYYRRENATVSSGALVITARREAFGGMQYTSARMKTQGRRSWKYGRIEARIAMPSFQGVWPAFWMLGDNISSIGWPACGEIDIMEHVNTGGTVHGTIHWQDHNNQYANYGGSTSTTITSFHNYTIEWDANGIRWFVDGAQYHAVNTAGGINGTSEFHNNFFILLNMAIGGNWPGFTVDNNAFPATMRVDYVRVYQAGSTPPPPTSNAPIGRTIAIRGNNNLFVSGNNGTAPLICNRTTAQAWEQFTVVDAGGGKVALRSMGKYVSSENGTAAMTANRTSIGDWEKFDWVAQANGTFALRGSNGRYVSSENGAANMMCNRTSIGGWEVFSYTIAAREATASTEESQMEDSALELFPNPAVNGTITINVVRPSQVTIIDLKGKPVVNEFVEQSLTVNNMASGLYIVNRTDKQSKSVKKLVIK